MTKSRTYYTCDFKLATISQVEAGVPIAQVRSVEQTSFIFSEK